MWLVCILPLKYKKAQYGFPMHVFAFIKIKWKFARKGCAGGLSELFIKGGFYLVH